MPRMRNVPNQKETQRMRSDQEELAHRIALALPRDGKVEVQPGVQFSRHSRPAPCPDHGYCEPAFCMIAQGSKNLFLGEQTLRYDPAHYLITTVDLPMSWQIAEASPDRPFLSFRLALDPSVVTQVMVEAGLAVPDGAASVRAADVSALDTDLLDATLRLVRLTARPAEYRVLSPLVIREIVYRLLTGTQAGRMRHLATFGGQAHRMVRAVQKLHAEFNQPLRIEEIARELGMSASGFHAHFKAVTAMSPLQFQKQLRLQEARRLMLSENLDAAEAGFRVGYEDAAHFNRDYKRHFGEPPIRDVKRMREMAAV